MREKVVLRAALALVTIALVAGCSSTGASTPAAPGNQSASGASIEWLYPGCDNPIYQKMAQAQIDRFQASQSAIKVKLTCVPWTQVHDQIVRGLASKSLPCLVQGGSRWLPEWADAGGILPLDKYFSNADLSVYFPNILKTVKYKGSLYAIPRVFSTQALIYRSDLIKTPPTTLDELVQTAKQIQAAHPGMKGFAYGAADHPSTAAQWQTFLHLFGGTEFKDGKVAFDSPEGLAALKFILSLKQQDLIPNPLEFHREQFAELFKAGKIAMFISGPWGGTGTGLKPDNPTVPYMSAPVPAGPGGAASEMVTDSTAIYSGCQQVDQAVTFLKYLMTPDEMVHRDLEGGYTPQSPAEVKRPEFANNPYWKAFIDAPAMGYPQPQPKLWEPYQRIVTDMVQSVFLGSATPEQALAKAAQQVRDQKLEPGS